MIDTTPSRRLPVYTRFNANDVLPDPITPLGASLAWIPHILAGFSLAYAEVGAATLDEAAGDEVWPAAAFFYGHLYVNVTLARLTGIRSGLGWQAIDAAFFGSHPDAPPHTPRPTDDDPVATAALAERTQWTLTTTEFPALEEEFSLSRAARDHRPDLSALSPAALVARARSMMPLERLMWRGEVVAGSQAAIGPAVMAQALGTASSVHPVDLIGPAGEVESAGPSFALWDLSRMVRSDPKLSLEFDAGTAGLIDRLAGHATFVERFAQFQREYGFRGPSEWDLGAPSWESHPELVLALVDRLRVLDDDDAPSARRDRQLRTVAARRADVEQDLAGHPDRLAMLQAGIAAAERFAAWRERGKSNCIRVLHEARMALRELGARFVDTARLPDADLVFMALDDELDILAVDPASLVETLLGRRARWLELFDLDLPMFVSGDQPLIPLSAVPRRGNDHASAGKVGTVLTGQACSAGTARGRTRVLRDPQSAHAFEPGEVLVAPQTDPSWTPLFLLAAAVVVEVGAMASHAMIVSRELGIPCVAGIAGIASVDSRRDLGRGRRRSGDGHDRRHRRQRAGSY